MLGALVIGLREGLEAALVVGILIAYARKIGRGDVVVRIWIGVALAVLLSLGLGALLTFGTYGLTFQAQETIGGLMSILAVALVTWMIFWMARTARTLKGDLERHVETRLDGPGWGLVLIGFVAVAREGLETALLLWSMVRSSGDAPLAWVGAVIGLAIAAVLGWAIYRGMVRIDLAVFFRWTGALLIVVAAGILAYGVHDLQEAGLLPGPWTPPPAGASEFIASWHGSAAWAFQLSGSFDPSSVWAALLQGTVGFTPDMTKLQLVVWAVYLLVVGFLYWRVDRRSPANSQRKERSTT